MKLSDLSIRRPVLATVMTLLLVLFGALSFTRLPVREFPDVEYPVVSVRTVYSGAGVQLMETEVTTVLEDALSGIEGLKTLRSTSREEVSQIVLEFELSRNLDDAANDVRNRVAGARRILPRGIEEPVVLKENADTDEIVWLALLSDTHTELEITDIAERRIKDQLASLPGVAAVSIDGERRYAMRLWLDPDRLAARRLTVQDVEDALRQQHVAAPSGRIESDLLEFTIQARGQLQTPAQFRQLILAYRDDYPVRLEDIGVAELGAEDDRKLVRVNGHPALGLGIARQAKANALAVAQAVKRKVETIRPTLPDGMVMLVAFDSSVFIERSIHEVYVAMAVAVVLVVIVIFLFLGNARVTIIPAVAIPASILGTFVLLDVTHSSLNVLTLLGFVLAIGLVVDDAIVMLENIHRRKERGLSAREAAFQGSREIAFAVLATTVSLVAVFIPILFLPGAIGRLFGELALAVAGSVFVSGFIALTLTPMMCARMLASPARSPQRLQLFNALIARLAESYRRTLVASLRKRSVVVSAGGFALAAGVWLLMTLPSELAPQEDTGWFAAHMIAPEGSTIRFTDQYARQVETLLADVPEIATVYTVVARGSRPTVVSRAVSWPTLKDWDVRARSQQEVVEGLGTQLEAISGVTAFALNPPPFNQDSDAAPVQLVVGGVSYDELERTVSHILRAAVSNPNLINVETDLRLNKPELAVSFERAKAAGAGISVATIAHTLESLLGGRKVTHFMRDGKEYPVIVKVHDADRQKPTDIQDLHVRAGHGELIALRNFVTVTETVGPTELKHYDRLRAVTISASLPPGVTLGQGIETLERLARTAAPPGATIQRVGQSKEFQEARGGLYMTFVLALLVIYLVLAAQFESFVDPLIILLAVPPAVTGAVLALKATGGSLNIFSQIGLVMLIGLVSKNSILIVEFANQLRARGMDTAVAVVEAATLRLRPILMTTAVTILGAVPLAWPPAPGQRADDKSAR